MTKQQETKQQEEKKGLRDNGRRKTKLQEVSEKVIALDKKAVASDKLIKEMGGTVFANEGDIETNLAKIQIAESTSLNHQKNWNRLQKSFNVIVNRLNEIEIKLGKILPEPKEEPKEVEED